MTDHDIDAQLCKLFAEEPPAADAAFADRVVALAAYDQAARRTRRRALRRAASDSLALVAVVATFALLARAAPVAADLGDTIPLTSPAMLGVAMIGLWSLVGLRPAAAGR